MLALGTFFAILVISLLVVRIATVALTLTGLSADVARFQARSAWTGTGFTTNEAEGIMGHPVRRRIVSILMVARSAGLVTAAATLIVAFAEAEGSREATERMLIVLLILLLLWLVSMSRFIDRQLSRLISWALVRFARLDARDYVALLHLSEEYRVGELAVEEHDWLAGHTLMELNLPVEGIVVLGITRQDGTFIGAPRGNAEIRAGDVLSLYGRRDVIRNLDERPAGLEGQREHYETAAEQAQRETEEERRERERREAEARAAQNETSGP